MLQEQQLCYLKLQDQRQQQQEASEHERLRQLRENAHNQEAKLRRVRALRGQVEQKRLSNSKLGQCDRDLCLIVLSQGHHYGNDRIYIKLIVFSW